MKNLLILFLMISSQHLTAQKVFLLTGSYTGSGSAGIYVYEFDQSSGKSKLLDSAITENPSFLAISPDQKFVYAVNEEGDGKGAVSAFSFDNSNGSLKFLNKQLTGGDHPCYVSVHETGKWVVAGNYSGGNVSLFPVSENGRLETRSQLINHEGRGPHARQQSPHVHATVFSPDQKYLFVPDLGIDSLKVYKFDVSKGKLRDDAAKDFQAPPGSGPRHLDFHPNGKFLYLLNELSGSISVLKYKKGKTKLIQELSSLPAGFDKKFTSADIHVSPDGKFLYASNRDEANHLAIFSIEKKGKLSLQGHQSVLGRTPRNFNIDPSGRFLLVANQNSDEIVVFRRDTSTGELKEQGMTIATSKPVCLKWIVPEKKLD